jgi:soluble lytic murein transglycosylase-like protein
VIKLITTTLLFSLGVNASADTKPEIVFKIQQTALEEGVDPDLAVAIATVESSLNPEARGALGEVGLFQLRPEYHDVIKGNTDHNTRIALKYLADLQRIWSPQYGNSWFVLYNWGPNKHPQNPRQTVYFKKVMREVSNIKYQRYLAIY